MIFRRCGFLRFFCLSIPIVFCLIPFIITPAYAAKSITVGTRPVDLALQDLDGDGHCDIVVVDAIDGCVSVLMGNGDGTFQDPVNYPGVGVHAVCVAIGDINGDDNLDLIVTNWYGDTAFFVLSGNGDGTFQDPVGFPHFFVLEGAKSVALGDLNGDNNLDLVLEANNGFLSIVVLLGNGDGAFQDPVIYWPGDVTTNFVTLEDLNGDDNLDVIVALDADGNSKVGVLLGNGDGTFQSAVTYEVGGEWPEHIAVGYLNGDTNLDLAVTNYNSGDVSVLLGNGDGTFQNATTYEADLSNPESVAIGDLNDDGHVDLAVADGGGSWITVFLGKGDGAFEEGVLRYRTVGNLSVDVALADLDGDGFLDIVALNENTPGVFNKGNVSIYSLRLLSPTDGATVSGPPSFKWTPGTYDYYLFYSKFFYSIDIEVGPFTYTVKFYYPIFFPLEDNSLTMPTEWWDYLDTSRSHYWRILGYNVTTENFDITETWSFKKAP